MSSTCDEPLFLCIDRVNINLSEAQIVHRFTRAIGGGMSSWFIDHVDMIKCGGKNGEEEYWRVYIQLLCYPETDEADFMKQQIREGKSVSIIFRPPSPASP